MTVCAPMRQRLIFLLHADIDVPPEHELVHDEFDDGEAIKLGPSPDACLFAADETDKPKPDTEWQELGLSQFLEDGK